MDKRLAKRHKRQVTRARENVKLSEPDLRTPEEIKAAREASRASINQGGAASASSGATSVNRPRGPAVGGAAKTDAG